MKRTSKPRKPKVKTTSELLRESIAERNPDAITFDGCDAAIIGTAYQHGGPELVVYDYQKLVTVFYDQFRKDRSAEEAWQSAVEWVDANVACLYVGEHTPLIFTARRSLLDEAG